MALGLICCEAPTTITSRGLDADTEKERVIMQGIALETYYSRLERLNNIAWPILQKSTDFCGANIKKAIGLEIISINQIKKEFKKAASDKLNFTEANYFRCFKSIKKFIFHNNKKEKESLFRNSW